MTGEVKLPLRAGREQQQQQQQPPLNSPSSSSSTSTDKRRRRRNMSKLSPGLKALINAPFARPGPCRVAKGAASALMGEVFRGIAREARGKGVGARAWLAISVSAGCLVFCSMIVFFFLSLMQFVENCVLLLASRNVKCYKSPLQRADGIIRGMRGIKKDIK